MMKRPLTKHILLVGASGTLGKLISQLLAEELPNANVISASRTATSNTGLEHRRIDIADATTFAAALQSIDLLIHAAGPFDHDPTAIVTACLHKGIHYIDIAEDLVFIEKVKRAAIAIKQPSAYALSGCSTMPAMVSLYSQHFAKQDALHSVNVYLNLGSANPVSYGLMKGLLQPLGKKLTDGNKCFRKLIYRTHSNGSKKHYGNYAAPYSRGIKVGDKNVPLSFYTGFDRQYINYGLFVASYIIPHLPKRSLHYLSRMSLHPANIARKFGGKEGRLVIEACDEKGDAIDEIEIIAEKEGLKLPSAPAVWAAKALLGNRQLKKAYGVVELSDITTISTATEWIRDRSYTVNIDGSS